MDTVHLKFARNLVRIKESRGLSSWGLAVLCGVQCRVVRYWEQGERMPGILYGCRLARALGCRPEELLEGCDMWELPPVPKRRNRRKIAQQNCTP